jgi:hypothetical protein
VGLGGGDQPPGLPDAAAVADVRLDDVHGRLALVGLTELDAVS